MGNGASGVGDSWHHMLDAAADALAAAEETEAPQKAQVGLAAPKQEGIGPGVFVLVYANEDQPDYHISLLPDQAEAMGMQLLQQAQVARSYEQAREILGRRLQGASTEYLNTQAHNMVCDCQERSQPLIRLWLHADAGHDHEGGQ